MTFSNASANKRHGNGVFKWNFVRVFSPFSALFIILHCHAAPRIPCHNINTTCLPELIHLFCFLSLHRHPTTVTQRPALCHSWHPRRMMESIYLVALKTKCFRRKVLKMDGRWKYTVSISHPF